ncbi:polysaccharide biosynthesis/export family protein [Flavobacterium glaciei]|uniref:Polysaccharide export outer membrane protein n=1 Tax=Flavobacterium glaciei TaxID=386300 RepID=A0A562Q5W5_9FLAO|nr:polysaccharide biosynthesis/export family protein [Flavobacterium glaciei]RDI58362.1 polysaccharide export outer membrane protein [Flavobacterium glaciei]TWI52147.1 polysaccharide export outer membrane protein [Flavobacterium glaciei]
MKHSLLLNKIVPFIILVLLFSCASKKDMIYYQDVDVLGKQEKANSYEITIQPDDLLSIIVSAEDPEIAAPFNLTAVTSQNVNNVGAGDGQLRVQRYLVDANGNIDFPILGKLKLSGLSRTELLDMLHAKISTYIKNPIVNIRIANFKVSVQGEVNAPGSYTIESERITLIEALTMAKDLTVYGKRNNILIIREIDGVKSYNRVDITNASFMNSPFYYLAQNDVIYVEPNQNKINSAAVGPSTTIIFSITSILITLATLIISSSK